MSEFHKDVVSADGVSSTPHRHGFDWWTSLGRVLASVEAVRWQHEIGWLLSTQGPDFRETP